MSTVVDIVNLALAKLGDRANVVSIDPPEGGTQADHAARFYPMARDTALAAHDWSFASTYGTLAQLTNEENPHWLYTYAVPNTAITIRELGYGQDSLFAFLPSGPHFEMGSLASGALVLHSNVDDIGFCRFTRRVSDPTKFSPLFTEALTYLLASHLAGPVVRGKTGAQVSQAMYNAYLGIVRQAIVVDANQSSAPPRYKPSSARARGFGAMSGTIELAGGARAELPFWAV